MFKKFLVPMIVLLVMFTIACKKQEQKSEEVVTEEVKVTEFKAPVKPDVDTNKKYVATIKTTKGDIICELFAKDAPLSVTNFKYLADNDFYKGLLFHRVVPNFVIQGGDPTGTGSGGPGYTMPAEIGKPHPEGALAWARTGDEINPERRSSGSQFYITLKTVPALDGAYTVFGQTIEGQDIVQKVEQGDKILDVVVEVKE